MATGATKAPHIPYINMYKTLTHTHINIYMFLYIQSVLASFIHIVFRFTAWNALGQWIACWIYVYCFLINIRQYTVLYVCLLVCVLLLFLLLFIWFARKKNILLHIYIFELLLHRKIYILYSVYVSARVLVSHNTTYNVLFWDTTQQYK